MIVVLSNGERINADAVEGGTKYILAKLLVDAMHDLGKGELNYREVKEYPRLPEDPNIYAFEFGSLEKACRAAPRVVKMHDDLQYDDRPGEYVGYLSSKRSNNRCHCNTRREAVKLNKEEMLDRLIELYENGKLSPNHIKRDPLLAWAEVQSLFGNNIKSIKAAVKREMYARERMKFEKDDNDESVEEGNKMMTDKLKEDINQTAADIAALGDSAAVDESNNLNTGEDSPMANDQVSLMPEQELESKSEKAKNDNRGHRWTVESAINAYYEACKKVGRWISYTEIPDFSKRGEMASLGTVSRKMGGLRKMQEAVVAKYGEEDWMMNDEAGSAEEGVIPVEELANVETIEQNNAEQVIVPMAEQEKIEQVTGRKNSEKIAERISTGEIFNPEGKKVIIPIEWIEMEDAIYVKRYQII